MATTPNRSNYVPRVLVLGDSISHGFGGSVTVKGWEQPVYLSALAAGQPIFFVGFNNNPVSSTMLVDPFDSGVNGTLISGMRYFDAATYRADVVLMASGANDANTGRTSSQMLTDIVAVCNSVKTRGAAFPWCQFIVMEGLNQKGGANAAVLEAYNAGLAAALAGLSFPVTIGRQYGLLADANFADQLHPNASGYAILGPVYYALIAAAVRQVLATS